MRKLFYPIKTQQFLSTNDLHIAGDTILAHAGTSLSSILINIDGAGRDPTNPDIGADEFSSFSDVAAIDLSEYISSFCNYFFGLVGLKNVRLIKELSSVTINMGKAVNFGLVLSELLTNAYKHGIQTTSEPEITISLTEINNMIVFRFGDNGPGISDTVLNSNDSGTYGLEMVKGLIEQIGGTCDIVCDDGTNYLIQFYKQTSNKT